MIVKTASKIMVVVNYKNIDAAGVLILYSVTMVQDFIFNGACLAVNIDLNS